MTVETNTQMIPFNDVQRMGTAIARSGLFGLKNDAEAIALMLIAQSEGLHPASAARDYHIIQGRPSLKADAMLARFQQSGGTIKFTCLTESKVSAVFKHPQGGEVEIEWTLKMAENAELFKIENGTRLQWQKGKWQKGNWHRYPRQMLRARVISEGVRTIFPSVCNGFYTPEEVENFDTKPEEKKDPIKTDCEVVEDQKPEVHKETEKEKSARIKGYIDTATKDCKDPASWDEVYLTIRKEKWFGPNAEKYFNELNHAWELAAVEAMEDTREATEPERRAA